MQPRIKLGELLVRAGVITESKLKAALAEQKRWGGRLGKILVEMNFLSEDLMVKALSKQLALPIARLDELDVPSEFLTKIDVDFAQLHSVVPERYAADRKVLIVAMADPINIHAIDEISRRTGMRIEPTIGGERAISKAIRILYGTAPRELEPELQTPPPAVSPNAPPPNFPPSYPTAPGFSAQFSGVPTPAPGGDVWATRPPTNPNMAPVPPAVTSPSIAPHRGGISPSPTLELAAALDEAQRKQLKAIRTMVEILIEKGIFTRDEYLAKITRR